MLTFGRRRWPSTYIDRGPPEPLTADPLTIGPFIHPGGGDASAALRSSLIYIDIPAPEWGEKSLGRA